MKKPGIMIAIGKAKGPSMPPPTFGGKADRLPAPSPAMDESDDTQPEDEAGEAESMRRIESKLDEILSLIKNDGGEAESEQPGMSDMQGMK